MKAKTIFIIIVSALVTIVLMKNTEEVNFWIFKDVSVPKLAVLGVLFALGFIVGFLARRPKRREEQFSIEESTTPAVSDKEKWDDENKDYIT